MQFSLPIMRSCLYLECLSGLLIFLKHVILWKVALHNFFNILLLFMKGQALDQTHLAFGDVLVRL